MEGESPPPGEQQVALGIVARLEERFSKMSDELERLNGERGALEAANQRMDVEIERGSVVVEQLRGHAEALEADNEKRRAENAALRERIRRMHEMLDK